MKTKFNVLLILVLGMLTFGCTNQPANKQSSTNQIIEINVLEAIKNDHDFPLSKLINEVDLVEFESTVDSYFENPRCIKISKNYILICCGQKNKVLLFDRQGQFIKKIGRQGKGPGEYIAPWFATIDPSDELVLVVDVQQKRLIKYSITVGYEAQVDLTEVSKQGVQAQPVFLNKEHFALALARPKKPSGDFNSILIFDTDLNLVQKALPRPNDEELCLFGLAHKTLDVGEQGVFFWETVNDTVYSIDPDFKSSPTYYFTDFKNPETKRAMKDPFSWEEETYMSFIGGIMDTKKYLIAWASYETSFLLFYDKKKGESFSVADPLQCNLDQEDSWPTHTIENDIFGFEPVQINKFHTEGDFFSDWFDLNNIERTNNLQCISDKPVTNPKLRDELLSKFNNFTGEELPILILMHSK